MRWLYRIIRKKMDPISFDEAEKWKKRWALAYGFIAWNAIGYICYLYYQGRGNLAEKYGLISEEQKNMPASVHIAQTLGIQKAHIVRYRGFTKIDEFDYDETKKSEETPKLEETKSL